MRPTPAQPEATTKPSAVAASVATADPARRSRDQSRPRDAAVMREASPPARDAAAASASAADESTGLVCPFCANVRAADAVGPCPRCTMEDTPTSRRSTGERIGPWFVLQRKNPTAPGLRFNVLLALARRGHVTTKSIVRGPTTGQLWRFASQVKGLSRVFGLCWHCAASVSPEAISCPRCRSPQDVPGDADAFLEPPANLPVMREVSTDDDAATARADEADLDRAAASLDADDSDPIVPVPEEITLAAARRAASIAQASANSPAPRTAGETIMSARELAAVFSLDPRPPGLRHRAGRAAGAVGKVAALVALLGVGAVAAALVAKPEWRAPIVKFAQDFVRPQASTQPTTNPSGLPTAGGAEPQVLTRSVAIGAEPAAPADVLPKAPTTAEPPKPPARSIPDPKPDPTPVATVVTPPPVVPTPIEPATSTPSLPKPSSEMSLDDAVLRAAELRRQALEAESAGEFARMVKLLEEVETLRNDAHPIDLSILLTRAREKLARQQK